MICDPIVGQNRRRIKEKNLFTPNQIASEFKKTKSVEAEVLKGSDSDFTFRIGQKNFLNKYFEKLPGGYTLNYVFEFTKGVLTMRSLCSTPDDKAVRMNLFRVGNNYEETPMAIIRVLFGVDNINSATMLRLNLQRTPTI